jgi:hypothetical protein
MTTSQANPEGQAEFRTRQAQDASVVARADSVVRAASDTIVRAASDSVVRAASDTIVRAASDSIVRAASADSTVKGLTADSVPDWHAAWVAALDELELDVCRAEELLSGDHALRESAVDAALRSGLNWAPRTDLPPIPADLVGRAQGMLARQLATAAELAKATTATRRQMVVAGRMSSAENQRPAYVDRAV